jgi:hypothetical protein
MFIGDIVDVDTTYLTDERNTEKSASRILRVGGGELSQVASDIHWHIAAELWYFAVDEKRQEIVWVGVEDQDIGFEEYIDPQEAGNINYDQLENEKRLFDCIDCHNRATHIFYSVEELVDIAISSGRIDRTIPFIKKEALEVLDPINASLSEAYTKIDALNAYYMNAYPDVYSEKEEEIAAALKELELIAKYTTFPHMMVTPETYIDNSGHEKWPGCFRCHGKLIHADGDEAGKVITSRCDLCHSTIMR